MNFGTKIYNWLFGKSVGSDEFGNKYYCSSKDFKSESAKRWVMFNGEIEASKIPPHWHAWLHRTINTPPVGYSHKYKWQKNHQPNMTGTSKAHFPFSHSISESDHSEITKKDYEEWKP